MAYIMIVFKEFMDGKPSLIQIKSEIQRYVSVEQEIDGIKPTIDSGQFKVSTGKVALISGPKCS